MEYCGIQIGYGVAVARMIRDDKESWFRDLHGAETVYDQTDNEFEMSKIAGRVNALTDVIATYPTIISKHLSGKHIYLSGPVTAIEDRNANTFSAAEAVLSLFGAVYIFDPVNSVDKDVPSMYLNANCAQCGRLIKYGGMYKSRELYTDSGEGYAVCKECHAKEIARENKIRGLDNRNETT